MPPECTFECCSHQPAPLIILALQIQTSTPMYSSSIGAYQSISYQRDRGGPSRICILRQGCLDLNFSNRDASNSQFAQLIWPSTICGYCCGKSTLQFWRAFILFLVQIASYSPKFALCRRDHCSLT